MMRSSPLRSTTAKGPWLRAHQKEIGYDASHVVVAGHSAGRHLEAFLGRTGCDKDLEGTTAGHLDQSSTVQGVIDYFSPSDIILCAKSQSGMTEEPNGFGYKLLGGPVTGNDAFARKASPVFHVGRSAPPILIIHGDKDQQVMAEQSQRLLAAYQAIKIDAQLYLAPGKSHSWNQPEPKEQELILEFLAKEHR